MSLSREAAKHVIMYFQNNFGNLKHKCWLLGHRVIHAKFAAARTHDASVFTTRQQAQ